MQTDTRKSIAGIRVVKPRDMPEWGVCMAIYGSPGVGKTTCAADAEDCKYGSPAAIIDAEGGVRSVSHRDIDIIPVRTWPEVEKVVDSLMHDCPWKTLILDNMSEFQSMNINYITGGKQPQIQDWGKSTSNILSMVRKLRDMAQRNSVNIIFIAWESPEKDEESGIIKRDIGFTPSLAKQFPGIVDIVGYLTVQNDGRRVLSFAPSTRSAAKMRRSKLEGAAKIPLTIVYGPDDRPMVDLLNVLRGGEDWPTEKYSRRNRATEGVSSESQS